MGFGLLLPTGSPMPLLTLEPDMGIGRGGSAPKGAHLSTRGSCNETWEHHDREPLRFPQIPFQYPRSRKATLAPHPWVGNLRGPDCTLSRLAVHRLASCERDRPATQTIATPRPSAGWSPPKIKNEGTLKLVRAMNASPHPGADGLIQGELPPST